MGSYDGSFQPLGAILFFIFFAHTFPIDTFSPTVIFPPQSWTPALLPELLDHDSRRSNISELDPARD
jgi:hypothetical protein